MSYLSTAFAFEWQNICGAGAWAALCEVVTLDSDTLHTQTSFDSKNCY